jgi:hypothetical protein
VVGRSRRRPSNDALDRSRGLQGLATETLLLIQGGAGGSVPGQFG